MEKLKNYFKLGKDASEDSILEKVTDLNNVIQTNAEELSARDAQISTLQAELESMRTSHTALNDSLADTIVASAIADGKITKDSKDVWIEAAKKDTEAVTAQLKSLKAIATMSVQTSVINGQSGGAAVKPEDNIVAWVRSEEGARILIDLEQSNSDEFQRLWDLYEDTLKKA
jgi:hypothetical protein